MFKVGINGTGFALLKQFVGGSEGAKPMRGLALSGGVLYGTTLLGGISNAGTVFKINTDGSGYAVI